MVVTRPPSACQYTFYDSKKEREGGPAQIILENGMPVDNASTSQTVGPTGPVLLQDFRLLEVNAKFNRERVPERVVHAKGAGCAGYFEVTKDITQYCSAALFSSVGKRTPLAVRFSSVVPESGGPDMVRCVRGYAVKFYTEEGNWDLVGNNLPVFFIRDGTLFPHLNRAMKRNPRSHLRDGNAFWDFMASRPETAHLLTMVFADRGIPSSFREMNGYGNHAFKNVNSNGEACYVKYHYKSKAGFQTMSPEKAAELNGMVPDYATADLFDAIEQGNFPEYTLYIQVMTLEQVEHHLSAGFNPFDVTKVWPHGEYPLIEVGRIILDRNHDNYFQDVEQFAVAVSNLVPGIEPSPDKLMQSRLFAYADAHNYRLGTNAYQIPVNQARGIKNDGKTSRMYFDGVMRVDGNGGAQPNYFPNTFNGPHDSAKFAEHVHRLEGLARRFEEGPEDFSQVRKLYYDVYDSGQRTRLIEMLSQHLAAVDERIRTRAINNIFRAVDAAFGEAIETRVAEIDEHGPHKPVGRGDDADAAAHLAGDVQGAVQARSVVADVQKAPYQSVDKVKETASAVTEKVRGTFAAAKELVGAGAGGGGGGESTI